MQSASYRDRLSETLKILEQVTTDIYGSMINVFVAGDLQDWNAEVPLDEVHQFDFELFENSDDPNIKALVKLIENLDYTYRYIENINAIR